MQAGVQGGGAPFQGQGGTPEAQRQSAWRLKRQEEGHRPGHRPWPERQFSLGSRGKLPSSRMGGGCVLRIPWNPGNP